MNKLVTTAISYTNGSPHIGHLYESVLSDFMKHLLIISSNNTKLLTGSDEHGKKIEETAIKNNIKPIELCNKYSEEFKKLNNNIKTKYDNFIRTTEEDHVLVVQEALKKVLDNGNIYLGTYKGWYNTREEMFMSELDCKLNNYNDPISGKPYELIEEETYYFKLSSFKNELIEYVKKLNVSEYIKNDLLLKLEDLKDLSISRTSFNWGIKFPFNDKHIVYVWFDALLNYITGKNRLFEDVDVDVDVDIIHIIGKDIVWFHAVIYPAILMALGKQKYISNNIFIHGIIMDQNGNKMSKSLGNIIDVDYLINKFNIEAIRFYLITNTTNEDINLSEERLISQYNNELIKSFGNLFQRVYKLLIPIQNEINILLKDKKDIIKNNFEKNKEIINNIISNNFNIKKYIEYINEKLSHCNKKITDDKPWEKEVIEKVIILTDLLIELDNIMILLYPVIPDKINELRKYLGLENVNNNILQNDKLTIKITEKNIKAFMAL